MQAHSNYYFDPRIFLTVLFLLLFTAGGFAQNTYRLELHLAGKDTAFGKENRIQTSFINREEAARYIDKLPSILLAQGYITSSIDSISYEQDRVFILLFLGKKYQFSAVNTRGVPAKDLAASGWKFFGKKEAGFKDLKARQEALLDYYERTGYPFASVGLDSVEIKDQFLTANLVVNKGPLYHIDSIRTFGPARIRKYFLEKYLGIPAGSIYDRGSLDEISQRLRELPYLKEQRTWDMTMLGTGGIINLYLEPKRSSQINFLVGFLPGNGQDKKLQLTGDVNLDLKNALATGENILLNWQQYQPNSPRLTVGYYQPYIFKSSFGVDLNFDLLKRDSSYLQIRAQAGLQYILSARQSGKIFFQNDRNFLLQGAFDTNSVRRSRQLPATIDYNALSLGLDYELNKTDYKLNPGKGNELRLIFSAGTKKVTMNNDIIKLNDPSDPSFNFKSLYDSVKLNSYQFRARINYAHYFPAGKNSVLKVSEQGGAIISQQVFKNELFLLGGYKLLRGFSDQSILADQYSVTTAEYRYLTGINSYFFIFADLGLTRTKFLQTNFHNSFIGSGIGLNFETNFGLLNFSYAVGKRNDLKFDLRQSSKIHFGFISFF